jgi:hypothetical protein
MWSTNNINNDKVMAIRIIIIMIIVMIIITITKGKMVKMIMIGNEDTFTIWVRKLITAVQT